MDWFGKVPYSSWPGEVRITIGGSSLFLGNARWMANLLFSDIPDNHPNLKFVFVESGVGWIPFLLEALDYQMGETAPNHLKHLDEAVGVLQAAVLRHVSFSRSAT